MSLSLRTDRRRRRPGVLRAALVAVLALMATAVAALAPGGDRPGPVAAAKDRIPISAPTAGGPDDATTPSTAPAAGAVAADGEDVPGVAPRPAAATMSFDAPIQGGLTAHQAQAASTALIASHADAGVADAGGQWTPAMGRTALARARSWLGMPYSWAGGAAGGPTAGRCDTSNGADLDCHIVGFDCSGLMTYAWGAYTALPHFAQTQRDAGQFHPSVEQLRAGDLVFFSGYLPDGIGHVAIYEGRGTVIEAPQSGAVVRRSALAELMAHDGTYRGAVRPLTPAAPTLAATAVRLPLAGGAVTVRGSHLSGVTSLTVAGRTHRIVNRSDTTITFDVPRAAAGRRGVPVTMTTSWGATSTPVTLAYAAPAAAHVPAPPTQAPVRTSPTKPAPVRPAPVRPSPVKPTPVKPTPVKPTPVKPAPGTPSPTKPSPSGPPQGSSTMAPTQSIPAPVGSSGAGDTPGR